MRPMYSDPKDFSGLECPRNEDGDYVIKSQRYTLSPDPDGTLTIDGHGPCGQKLACIGRIHDPCSENPVLELRAPLGLCGVNEILRSVVCWQFVQEHAPAEEPEA